jgi:hypothetical protein
LDAGTLSGVSGASSPVPAEVEQRMGTTGFVEWRPAYDDESERLVEAARGLRNIFGIDGHKESGGH